MAAVLLQVILLTPKILMDPVSTWAEPLRVKSGAKTTYGKAEQTRTVDWRINIDMIKIEVIRAINIWVSGTKPVVAIEASMSVWAGICSNAAATGKVGVLGSELYSLASGHNEVTDRN